MHSSLFSKNESKEKEEVIAKLKSSANTQKAIEEGHQKIIERIKKEAAEEKRNLLKQHLALSPEQLEKLVEKAQQRAIEESIKKYDEIMTKEIEGIVLNAFSEKPPVSPGNKSSS